MSPGPPLFHQPGFEAEQKLNYMRLYTITFCTNLYHIRMSFSEVDSQCVLGRWLNGSNPDFSSVNMSC